MSSSDSLRPSRSGRRCRRSSPPMVSIAEDNSGNNDGGSAAGCQHYKRKCKFYTPCCRKTYQCRFCHDSSENHVLRGDDVTKVVCANCGHKQGVEQTCQNCGTIFGRYFCYECKLFDDEDKAQFHCDGCGICRIGGRENFFHCVTCNMCLPTHLEGKHKCIENLSRANCPICQEDIHTSREPSQIPPCHHLIHKSCFDQLVRSGHYFCPVCAHSLTDMTEMWKIYDQNIAETPLPRVYQNLYAEIYCRDCLSTSTSLFHILGIKCKHCKGYNTVRERGPLMRKQGENDFCEADLTEDDVIARSGASDGEASSSLSTSELDRSPTQNLNSVDNSTDDGNNVVEEDEEEPAGGGASPPPLPSSSSTDVAMADEDASVPILRSSAQEWDDASMASTSSDK